MDKSANRQLIPDGSDDQISRASLENRQQFLRFRERLIRALLKMLSKDRKAMFRNVVIQSVVPFKDELMVFLIKRGKDLSANQLGTNEELFLNVKRTSACMTSLDILRYRLYKNEKKIVN